MAGTAELRAVLALQKKQLEQLAEQQQLFETLLSGWCVRCSPGSESLENGGPADSRASGWDP